VFRLRQLRRPLDIFLSHDWPRGIAAFGDAAALCRAKRFLAAEIAANSLGSPPGEELLHALRPGHWFSAHLHTKFAALVPHGGGGGGATRFLALDKCLPGRGFLQARRPPARRAGAGSGRALGALLWHSFGCICRVWAEACAVQPGARTWNSQAGARVAAADRTGAKPSQVVDFPDADGPLEFGYDEEWLAVLRGTHALLSLRPAPAPLPGALPHDHQSAGAVPVFHENTVCAK